MLCPRSPAHGFTLIELIMTIIVLSIAAAVATWGFLSSAKAIQTDQEIQISARLAQDCVSHITMSRYVPGTGWTAVIGAGNAVCANLPTVAGYTRTVTNAAIATDPPCFAGATCREFRIQVTVPSATYTTDVR